MRKLSIIVFTVSLFLLTYASPVFAQDQPCSGDCNTAIGPIPTTTGGFISRTFSLLLGLSGGIALILIIFSGYQLITSQGNPEKTQAARETLTSAITGLLFIIFSFFILEVVGISILHIPGFSHN